MLWEEYIEANPEGYRYSRFCELYRSWEAKLSVTLRQTHMAGDKLFVDYAGDTVPVIVDRLTGEVRQAQIFVAVMGASNFTYVEATWTQTLVDWIGAHTRARQAAKKDLQGKRQQISSLMLRLGLVRHGFAASLAWHAHGRCRVSQRASRKPVEHGARPSVPRSAQRAHARRATARSPGLSTCSMAPEGELRVAVEKIVAWREQGLKPSEIVLYRANTESRLAV